MPNRSESLNIIPIETIDKEVDNISRGSIYVLNQESDGDQVSFLIRGETQRGQEDGRPYTHTISNGYVDNLPRISDKDIQNLLNSSGPISFSFYQYDAFDRSIIWQQKTEYMGFGHGYETEFSPFVLTKNEEQKNKSAVYEGLLIKSSDQKTFPHGGVAMIVDETNNNFAKFIVQEKRVYGEPDPEMRQIEQTRGDILSLPTITPQDIRQEQNTIAVWSDFFLFTAFNGTIVWKETTHRGGDFEGNDVYYTQYRLVDNNAPARTNINNF